jgi:hypothetical protein
MLDPPFRISDSSKSDEGKRNWNSSSKFNERWKSGVWKSCEIARSRRRRLGRKWNDNVNRSSRTTRDRNSLHVVRRSRMKSSVSKELTMAWV